MERRPVVVQVVLFARPLLVLGLAQLGKPAGAVGAAGRRLAEGLERRRHAAEELGRGLARVGVRRRRRADHDDLGLLAERAAEAEPEVHRHADYERDVGALEGLPARA